MFLIGTLITGYAFGSSTPITGLLVVLMLIDVVASWDASRRLDRIETICKQLAVTDNAHKAKYEGMTKLVDA